MENRRKNGVFEAIRMAAVTHRLLTAGTVLCAAASVAASLVPPLLLARIVLAGRIKKQNQEIAKEEGAAQAAAPKTKKLKAVKRK